MEAIAVYRRLSNAGVHLTSRTGKLLAAPPVRLDDELRALIRANRDDLLVLLDSASDTTTRLLEAAMRMCDRHGDNEAQREEMRRDCLELPAHLQADLLAHFRGKQ